MEITPLGLSSFKLRGKAATVVLDPFDPKVVGLKFPKVSADIVVISHEHPDHNRRDLVDDAQIVIEGPGEYEVKGVKVLGISTYHDKEEGKTRGKNTVYRIVIDKVSIVHLGDLGHKLSDAQVDLLEGVDIVLIPVGGVYTITPQEAAVVVSQIEPKMIIPMHYGRPELSAEVFGKLSPVSDFLKEMGKEVIVPQPKLVITKDKLPIEPTIIVLE